MPIDMSALESCEMVNPTKTFSQTKKSYRDALVVGVVAAVLACGGTTIYFENRGPSNSYVDGYNFAVAFTHGSTHSRVKLTRVDANSSCSVWSFSNAGGVPAGDVPREWRQGCESALTSGSYNTIGR
jgi:hypothetical protein